MRALIAALLALLACVATPAAAEERIRNFHSRLELSQNGQLTVTETIRVQVEGRDIRRGIYRDLPTRYRLPGGGSFKVGFTFLDAELDGRTVPHKLQRRSNGVRIRLGDPDTLVPHGSRTYRIRYSVRRAVGFFDDFDELYWNVTGTGWQFPIDGASATIVLPTDAEFGNVALYTGSRGSTASNARIVRSEPGRLKVETTQPLRPFQGLTVAAAFPKGVIAPPSEGDRLVRKIADYSPLAAAILGVLLVAGYYLWAYFKIGRDPRAGTIVPLFAPPDDMSPAAIRYVTRQKTDHRSFAAALVEAGVKGHVRIEENGGGSWLSGRKAVIHREFGEGKIALGLAEQRMLSRLVSPGSSIEMDDENHADFSAARRKLDNHYSKLYEGKAFHRNLGWSFAGVLVMMAALALLAAAIVWSEDLASPMLPLFTVATLLIATLLFAGAPDKGQPGRKPIMIVGALVALGSGALGLAMLPLVNGAASAGLLMIVVLVGTAIAASSFYWISAPTAQGRALLDRIAGFKRYLSATEGERFDRMQPPGEDLKLFERYLPYAIALEVENKWAKRFESQLAAAATAPDRDRGFNWYSGSENVWNNPTGFTKAMGASLSSAISSASSAPGSSSGSGGGGSSGGGGGGGGGGGW